MKSTRKFVYAVVLAATAFTFKPVTASAQAARGHFTLPHDVRWQNAAVPAGDYRFTIDSKGASAILTLTKMSGERTGFMLLVNDIDTATTPGIDKLVLHTKGEGKFVSEMELPEYGMTLHFRVPAEAESVVAANTASVVAGSK